MGRRTRRWGCAIRPPEELEPAEGGRLLAASPTRACSTASHPISTGAAAVVPLAVPHLHRPRQLATTAVEAGAHWQSRPSSSRTGKRPGCGRGRARPHPGVATSRLDRAETPAFAPRDAARVHLIPFPKQGDLAPSGICSPIPDPSGPTAGRQYFEGGADHYAIIAMRSARSSTPSILTLSLVRRRCSTSC
jgi:hypothetical protein